MERKRNVFTRKSSLEFGEDVKKRLRLLSEVVLRTVKRRLTSSFAIFIFFKIKMAARFFIATRHSETHFELKNSEFCCEMKLQKSLQI